MRRDEGIVPTVPRQVFLAFTNESRTLCTVIGLIPLFSILIRAAYASIPASIISYTAGDGIFFATTHINKDDVMFLLFNRCF